MFNGILLDFIHFVKVKEFVVIILRLFSIKIP